MKERPHQLVIAVAVAIGAALFLSGCTLGDQNDLTGLNGNSRAEDFARGSGSPALATKNTIRIPGEDSVGNAAGAALTVYPSNNPSTRPKVVTVAERHDWRAAVALSVLSARPLSAPMLLSEKDGVPDVTKSALNALNPTTATIPGLLLKPKAIVAGNAKIPDGVPRINLANDTYEKLSLSIDTLWTKFTGGKPSPDVIVTTADPAFARFALPAGPLAANTGSPVFFVNHDTVPRATLRAIASHKKPNIYIVGPPAAISENLLKRLRRFGPVARVTSTANSKNAPIQTPAQNSVEVATYSNPASEWGWGVTDPGHGFVVINSHHEMDIAAATTLSSGAAYGPLLLNSSAEKLDPAVSSYLLNIQPGYLGDPTRGVYNRAWLLGDEQAISASLQAEIDKLCEILPITSSTGAAGADNFGE
ncbi:MAG: cell wall-binding repeat-containing protein [Solirubrobacterales bacterium]